MKERPILFSGPMVRAILEGRKTQTRRVAVPRHDDKKPCEHWSPDSHEFMFRHCEHGSECRPCPYGLAGDQLWVRETFADVHHCGPNGKGGCAGRLDYKADKPPNAPYRWTPSIHMPRWASRIQLEITAVRVERVQDISEADAIAEGIMPFADGFAYDSEGRGFHCTKPSVSYAYLWDSTYGNWEINPWVWVIEFRRIK